MLHVVHGALVVAGALVVTGLLLPAHAARRSFRDLRRAAAEGSLVQRARDRAAASGALDDPARTPLSALPPAAGDGG